MYKEIDQNFHMELKFFGMKKRHFSIASFDPFTKYCTQKQGTGSIFCEALKGQTLTLYNTVSLFAHSSSSIMLTEH